MSVRHSRLNNIFGRNARSCQNIGERVAIAVHPHVFNTVVLQNSASLKSHPSSYINSEAEFVNFPLYEKVLNIAYRFIRSTFGLHNALKFTLFKKN